MSYCAYYCSNQGGDKMFKPVNKEWEVGIEVILCGDPRCGWTNPGAISL